MSCSSVLGSIALFGIALLGLYMYNYMTMSLYIVNLEKCRDKPTCDLEPIVSWWGVFTFAFQIIFLVATLCISGLAVGLCLPKNIFDSVNKPAQQPNASATPTPNETRVDIETASDAQTVKLEDMI
ncbi:hypothetical protein F-S17_0292 [Faustovirus]|nr:hypothetical protein F-S17_0292 [Faustovirus]